MARRPTTRTPRKKAAQRRAEEEAAEEAAKTPEDKIAETEVIHGDIVISPEGEIEVANPAPPNRQLSTKERQRTALNLKMMGASYAAIAEQLGYADASGAHQAVKRAMEVSLKDAAIDLRNMTYMQLQQLLMVWWPKAIKGDASATSVVLGINDRIVSLFGLQGLPAAEEILSEGVLSIGGTKDEYIEGIKKMRKGQQT